MLEDLALEEAMAKQPGLTSAGPPTRSTLDPARIVNAASFAGDATRLVLDNELGLLVAGQFTAARYASGFRS